MSLLAFMTQRKRLDHFLLQKAAEAGAEIRDGAKVADVREGALTVDGEEIAARIVIGADGCNGTAAKALGLGGEIVHGVALEANFPHDARFAHAMVLELAVVRGGYGWIFPKGDHVNVGVGGDETEAPRLRAHLRRLCEMHGIAYDTATDIRGYRLPMRRPGSRLAHGTTAVIGDAAGLVDPFSGDGMYEAFLSAQLAAEAALDVLAGRAQTLEPYAEAVERRITPLTAAGWGAKVAFDRFPRTTFALARIPFTFRVVGAAPGRALPPGRRARPRKGDDPPDLHRREARGLKKKPATADPSIEPYGSERTTHACRGARFHGHSPEGGPAADLPGGRRPPPDAGCGAARRRRPRGRARDHRPPRA